MSKASHTFSIFWSNFQVIRSSVCRKNLTVCPTKHVGQTNCQIRQFYHQPSDIEWNSINVYINSCTLSLSPHSLNEATVRQTIFFIKHQNILIEFVNNIWQFEQPFLLVKPSDFFHSRYKTVWSKCLILRLDVWKCMACFKTCFKHSICRRHDNVCSYFRLISVLD